MGSSFLSLSLSLSLFTTTYILPVYSSRGNFFTWRGLDLYSAINFFPEVSILLETEKVEREKKERERKKKRAARRKYIFEFLQIVDVFKNCVCTIIFV